MSAPVEPTQGVALLREAAAKMQKRAEGATAGPWEPRGNAVQTVAVSTRAGYEGLGLHDEIAHLHMTTGNFQSEARNAEHIASWHPAVALAVAKLCEAMADAYDELRRAVAPSWSDEMCGDLASARVAGYAEAIASARTYLGRTP